MTSATGGRFLLAFLALTTACSRTHDNEPRVDGGGAEASPAPEPIPPPYGPEVKSLRLKRSIVVRMGPSTDAKAIGTIAQDIRVEFIGASTGKGCPRWIEIKPRGWVCDKYLEPSRKAPAGVELPKLKPGEIVPGVYGKVAADGAKSYKSEADVRAGKAAGTLAGAVTVRRMAEVVVDGRTFWKTSSGELIDSRKISPDKPSQFQGVVPGAEGVPALPLAWVQSRKTMTKPVAVYDGPDQGAKMVRKLDARTVVAVIGEPAADAARWQIAESEWVDRADLHLARRTDPPPGTRPDERWIDVDLDEQTLVAYDAAGAPAYATLVSTGNPKWPTQQGVYRIWIKFAETDMNGQMGDEQPYSVATVPWTMFFAKDLALHTSYWHDKFGEPRSHGCVNLSPKDARWLYFWATPDVPIGWSMAHGVVEAPGSIVRIRSAATPDPPFQGYAIRVYEARNGGVTPAAMIPSSTSDELRDGGP
jgi:hypothetical protein